MKQGEIILIPVDMPYVPQQVIERNVLIFQTANKKAEETAYEAAERKYLLQKCWELKASVDHKFAMYGAGGSSAHTQEIKRVISNYLLSVRTPIALKILEEIEKSQWKGYL